MHPHYPQAVEVHVQQWCIECVRGPRVGSYEPERLQDSGEVMGLRTFIECPYPPYSSLVDLISIGALRRAECAYSTTTLRCHFVDSQAATYFISMCFHLPLLPHAPPFAPPTSPSPSPPPPLPLALRHLRPAPATFSSTTRHRTDRNVWRLRGDGRTVAAQRRAMVIVTAKRHRRLANTLEQLAMAVHHPAPELISV